MSDDIQIVTVDGTNVAEEGFDVWLFDTGGEPRVRNLRRGGIWLRPNDEPLGVVVYIVVDDIEAILEKVAELGGEVVAPKPRFRTPLAAKSGQSS